MNTNLSLFTNYANEILEKKRLVTILKDFSKALDRLPDDWPFQKLNNLEIAKSIPTILWSYLKNRYYIIKHDGGTSNRFLTGSGVPQGSNLWLLLLVLFINDLPEVINF